VLVGGSTRIPKIQKMLQASSILLLLNGWISVVACISRKHDTDFNVNVEKLPWLKTYIWEHGHENIEATY
jgi:hypothetical protein